MFENGMVNYFKIPKVDPENDQQSFKNKMMAANDDPGAGGAPHGERCFPLVAQYPGPIYKGYTELRRALKRAPSF